MAITPNQYHDHCTVYVQLEFRNIKQKNGRWCRHYASLRCAEHDTHIQWLSRDDTENLCQMGIEIKECINPQ